MTDAYDGLADVTGNVLSLKANFASAFAVEVGRTYYGAATRATQANTNFISVQVDVMKLLNPPQQPPAFFAKDTYELASMVDHRFDKVRRENLIQVQSGRRFIVTASGI